MNGWSLRFLLLLLPVLLLPPLLLVGCGLVEGIFKAGVWVGILAVVAVIVLVALLAGKSRR